jgi:hypothetical protein
VNDRRILGNEFISIVAFNNVLQVYSRLFGWVGIIDNTIFNTGIIKTVQDLSFLTSNTDKLTPNEESTGIT